MIWRMPVVMALFPPFGPGLVGGVETSARIAFDAIAARVGHGGDPRASLSLITYGCGQSKLVAVARAAGRRLRPDVVVVWHLGLLKLVPFLRAPRAAVIVFLHGIEAWKPLGGLTRRLLRRVALFLSNSDHTWDRFVAWNPGLAPALHRTVHLGVGDALATAPPPPGDPPAAVMLGRLARSEDYKGHRETIAAWPSVLRRCARAELWIVGDGDLRPELEWLARGLGVAGSVRFLGQVPDERKSELLRAARCLVLPSRAEGFGLVYAEAMRVGRPCLAGSADAGREVVNPPEAGLAVDPADHDALAASVARLLDDGAEWQRWSEAARARHARHFTGRKFQERLLAGLSPHLEPARAA